MRTTDRHIDIGPHRHSPATDADDRSGVVGVPAAAEPFDQEINLRGIFWTAVGLVVVTVVSAALMWVLLRGFGKADERRDPPPSPMGAQAVQPMPPEPRLQTDDKGDLLMMKEEEGAVLDHPAWVSREQGSVRVPIGVAMQVIAARGVAPQVVGGTPGAAAPAAPPAAAAGPEMQAEQPGQSPPQP